MGKKNQNVAVPGPQVTPEEQQAFQAAATKIQNGVSTGAELPMKSNAEVPASPDAAALGLEVPEPDVSDSEPPLADANPVDRETIKAIASEDPILTHLVERIEALETLIIRMAHNSGTGHAIIRKAGLTPYNPTKEDMSKVRNTVLRNA